MVDLTPSVQLEDRCPYGWRTFEHWQLRRSYRGAEPARNAGPVDCDESEAKGRPISGVLETAASCTTIGPARNALRPPLTALANAFAIWTGSRARDTAVFNSTPSKPHSMT
jgi:hypothetical protein